MQKLSFFFNAISALGVISHQRTSASSGVWMMDADVVAFITLGRGGHVNEGRNIPATRVDYRHFAD
jgi:hypothetical protein